MALRNELVPERRYPHKFEVKTSAGAFQVKYRRTAWRKIDDSDGEILKKTVFAHIMQGRRRVGEIELVGFDVPDLLYNEDFIFVMDIEEQPDLNLGEVLVSEWNDLWFDVCDYGPIVEFRYLRMLQSPILGSPLWVQIAEQLLNLEFKNHSILALNAFPLEFAGRRVVEVGQRQPPEDPRLSRRLNALIRHYRRTLGVGPFKPPFGETGWLWRPHPRLEKHFPVKAAPKKRRKRRLQAG